MLVDKFAGFNVKHDKGKTPLIALRCADNRQLFEGTARKERVQVMRTYRAEIEDDNFEIILAEDDNDALKQYWELEEQGHELFNLYELDENYDIVRTLC